MKNLYMINRFYVATICFFLFVCSGNVWSAGVWDGGGSDNSWTTVANWDDNTVPASGSDVTIPTGFTVSFNTTISLANLVIQGGSSLIFAADNYALTITNQLTLSGTANPALNITSSTAATPLSIGNNNFSITSSAVALLSGETVSLGQISNTGTITAVGSTISGISISANSGSINFTNAPSISFDAAITNSATIDFSGSTTASIGSSITNNSGTFTIGNSLTCAGLTINGGTFVTGGGTFQNTGITSINAGSFTASGGSKTFDGPVSNAATLTLTGTTTNMNNTFTNSAGTTIVGTSLSITSTATISGGTLNTGTGAFSVGGTTSISGGSNLTVSTGTITFGQFSNNGTITTNGAATLNFNSTITAIGSLSLHSSTILNFGGDVGTVTLPAISNLATLTINHANNDVRLGTGLTTSGVVTITAGKLTTGAYVSSFGGNFTNTGTIDMSSSTITMAGTVTGTGTYTSTTANLILTRNGDVNIPAQITHLASLTINGNGNKTLNAGLTTTGNITVSNGTFITEAYISSFGGAVSNFSTLNMTNSTITFANTLSGAGTYTTNSSALTFTGADPVSLPSQIISIPTLTINKTNSLTLNNTLTVTTFNNTSGTLIVGNNTLTLPSYTDNVLFTLNAQGGTVRFNNASTFNDARFLTNSSTNLIFVAGTTTLNSGASALNNLTIQGGTLTLSGLIVLSGALSVTGGTFATDIYSITANSTTGISFGASITSGAGGAKFFNSTVTNGGTLNLSGPASSVTFNSTLTNTGTLNLSGITSVICNNVVTNTAGTSFNLTGTSIAFNSQFNPGTNISTDAFTNLTYNYSSNLTLPSAIVTLGSLIISSSGTVSISNNLALGSVAATDLNLSSTGNLELNGYYVTLANPEDVISESNTGKVTNNGTHSASTGYISTATVGATIAQIQTSGIGIIDISGLTVASIVIRRYPKAIEPIPGVANSVVRIYRIVNTGTLQEATFKYLTSELNENDPNDLTAYEASTIDFENDLRAALENTEGSQELTSSGGFAGTGTHYYAIATLPIATGLCIARTGDWNNPNIWTPNGIPDTSALVLVPHGVIVTIPDGYEATAKSITIEGTGKLQIVGYATKLILYDNGGIHINGTANPAFTTETSTGAVNIFIPGNIEIKSTGTINLSSAGNANDKVTVQLYGTYNNSGGGSFVTNGGADFGTIFECLGTVNITLPPVSRVHTVRVNKSSGGKVYQGAADLTIAGTSTLDVLSGSYIVGERNLTVDGVTNISLGAIFNGDYISATTKRTFNDDVNVTGNFYSRGTRHTSNLDYNNNFNESVNIASTGMMDVNYSKTTFSDLSETFQGTGSGALFYALGTDVEFESMANFTNVTFYTNSNTDLTFSPVNSDVSLPTSITNLLSLTINRDANRSITLNSDLKINQNLTLTLGTFNVSNRNLTIQGNYLCSSGNGILSAAGATLTFGGNATFGGAAADIVTSEATNIIFNGGGTISGFPESGHTILNKFTYNRHGETFTMAAFQIQNTGAASPEINIISGKVVFAANNSILDIPSTVTTIGANGEIDFVTFPNTFLGTVTGTGTLNISGSTAMNFSGPYSFTGNLVTSSTTNLIFAVAASGDVQLNSSVSNLNILRYNRAATTLTFNSNVTFATVLTANELLDGGFNSNGFTITIPGATDAHANWDKFDATNGSTLIFTGNAVLTLLEISSDETTNFEFRATPTLVATIAECNNLTLSSTGNITLFGPLDVYGNLTVGNGCTFNKSTFDLTVYGDVSNEAGGTITLSGAGGIIYLFGQMSGSGTYITANTVGTTQIQIKGTSSQFVMPSELNTCLNLTLDRPSGMKLNSNFQIGAAAVTGLVTITEGDLDLNGYILTLARTNGNVTLISETSGNTVINTGAVGANNGYVALANSTTLNDITKSGIGISAITTVSDDEITIYRYPYTVPVPGVGLSTSRVFYLSDIGVNELNSITFQYDNTELYSSASDLELYASSNLNFATNTNVSDLSGITTSVSENTPSSGFGRVALTQSATQLKTFQAQTAYYFTLAAVPGNGGKMFTWAGTDGGYWGTETNWNPNGTPSKVDQVVIGPSTVVLNGEGNIFECKTLNLNHANATLKPYDNSFTGDNVSLRVNGNITVAVGAEILGVNGKGRLNLIVGDGTTTGVSSIISVSNDYVSTAGIWLNNLTVNTAEVSFPSSFIRISGDITVLANAALQNSYLEFWGGANGIQTITVPSSALFEFDFARFDNNARVTTASDFEVSNYFLVKNGTQFSASNGTAYFPIGGAGKPWYVENGGTLKFWNVEFNDNTINGSYIPIGTAYIQGNFYQLGTEPFSPTSGTVIFQNTGQKVIVNTSLTASDLSFYNLQVASGSTVVTSNSWNVKKEVDVKLNASLQADNGTITMTGTAAPLYIKNSSTHTLEFYNLTIGASTFTSDSWTVKGDMVTNAAFTADNGTITFENTQVKTIDPNTEPSFFKIKVSDGSKLSTLTPFNFTIANNANNQRGAGIEVVGTGEFYVGDASSITTIDASSGVTTGYPKTITKSSAGRLDFGKILIAASANNEVATASDFKLIGTGASTFSNAGAGGKFTATAGTVTFSGLAPEIQSVSPAVTQFHSIKTIGTTGLVFPAVQQEIYIAGDVTIDGTSSITAGDATNMFVFNGSALQTIGGNSTALTPITLQDVVINKPNNTELLLGMNFTISSELTLTNGILNLGSKTLTNEAALISRHNGVINGGTGTYIISGAHQDDKLEDVYFTLNGTPTLYNLTVNAVHTTANDLTVNGTLNLNGANLEIGTGASFYAPIKLILNGNLTRVQGEIDGDPAASRLVLQGTGTVDGGMSNTYFSTGSATSLQLEIARQEVLGGSLNIVGTSFLRINTGINSFDLGTYTLTFDNGSLVTMLSGGIDSDAGKVVLNNGITTLPASFFISNTVKDITLSNADFTLASDLTINGTLDQANNNDIITKDNILTFGPNSTLPVFSANKHVIGNLRRTVKSTATTFSLGDGTYLFPVSLKFANGGNEQLITTSIDKINPVYGRGGNASNAVELLWNFDAEGSAPIDSMNLILQYESAFDGVTTPSASTTFPAKWIGTNWSDYRNELEAFTAPSPRVLSMASYPLRSSAELEGEWAVFSASANTDIAKDAAITTSKNKVVIKTINPSPVIINSAFKVTVELQDKFDRAITLSTPFAFTLSQVQGAGTFTTVTGVIPAGQSSVKLSGLTFSGAGINNQLFVDTTGSSSNWNPGLSNVFAALPTMPATQAHTLVVTNLKETSMTIDWTTVSGANELVIIKADSLLALNEYPVGGTTYIANTIMGAGSSNGPATVVYNGSGITVNVTGLSANTNYYVYVFTYDGANGNERYRTTAASGNPKIVTTNGSYDDDATLGTNNTRETSKTIGTNTPVSGTIKTADDIDWFNFTVTSTSPNVRGSLVLSSDLGNYDLELYNEAGRRIRRGNLVSNNTESQIINDLPAGTYTVKIMGDGTTYNTTRPYKLKVTTSKKEIFSVTP